MLLLNKQEDQSLDPLPHENVAWLMSYTRPRGEGVRGNVGEQCVDLSKSVFPPIGKGKHERLVGLL